MKQILKYKLDKYGYVYTEKGNQLAVKLTLNQVIKVDFSDSKKILITDELTSWNLLSGSLTQSLKKALLVQSISTVIIYVVLLNIPDLLSIASFLIKFAPIYFGWVILWGMFYLVRAESMKRQIISWMDGDE